jgi:hypothetical protein
MSSTTAGPKGALQPNTLIAGGAIVRGTRQARRGFTHGVQATANSVNLGIAIDDQATAEKPFPIADRPGESVEAAPAPRSRSTRCSPPTRRQARHRRDGREGHRHRAPGGDRGDQLVPVEIAPRGYLAP